MGIKLFGKNILQVYTHHIMKIDYAAVQKQTPSCGQFCFERIDPEHIGKTLEPIGTTVTEANLKRLVAKNPSLCEGFVLSLSDRTPVGTIWVMYRGGNDLEYRIRTIDAYIFDVYVNEAYRGKGYAGEMIRQIMQVLHDKGIDTAHLAVSVSNASAIRAYQKAGFTVVNDKKFARFLKLNLPYHAL